MLLQLGETEVPVAVGAKIHRGDLYGRQVKMVECGGEPLELGSALVRDTAVQRRIREDPALRAGWSDPDVRRVIEGRP